ncbi:MAG: hypothetical protein IT477_10435 [Rhodanobacteraceae bacterium]|nr:hypothetical protein [Rhodanobacteraceae bacterium]
MSLAKKRKAEALRHPNLAISWLDGGWSFQITAQGKGQVWSFSGQRYPPGRPIQGDDTPRLLQVLGQLGGRAEFAITPIEAVDPHHVHHFGWVESGGRAVQVPEAARASLQHLPTDKQRFVR